MIDSPTFKAIASTVLTFAIIIAVGTFTNAIGQNTAPQATAPTANPYETVESDAATAPHNHSDQSVSAKTATHNRP